MRVSRLCRTFFGEISGLAWSLAFGVPGGMLMAPELAPRTVNVEPKAGAPVPLSDLPNDLQKQVLEREKAAGEEKAKPVVALIVLAVSFGSIAAGVLTLTF